MEPISVISLIKNALLDLKKQRVEQISVDGLIDYLSQLEARRQHLLELTQPELEQYKAQLAMWIENQRHAFVVTTEGFKSVILSGQNALRSALLINGGASIALLAYIGKLKVAGSTQLSSLAFPLLLFVIGVLVTAVNSGITYLSQWFYFGGASWKQKAGFYLNIANIVLGIASYFLFAVGTFYAYRFFAH